MSDYHATSRSNYFRVKDEPAFKEWARKRFLEVFQNRRNSGLWGIMPDPKKNDFGTWPNYDPDAPAGQEEFDLVEELSKHLADGCVAILISSGHQKSAYIGGEAVAINSRGETREVRLDNIHDLASQLGWEVTRAEE